MELLLAEAEETYGGLPAYVAQLNVPAATLEAVRERLLD
jgi:hypothetical protein